MTQVATRTVNPGGMRAEREKMAREFGRRLLAVRERRGLSQEALAKKAGVARTVVAFAELGTSLPYPRNRKKLADALGVDMEELWG